MSYKPRRYRNGYINVHMPDGEFAMYVGNEGEWGGIIRQWCVDNGYSKTGISTDAEGFSSTINWGIGTDDGRINVRIINMALAAFRERARMQWPADARESCERYEKKLYEMFRESDAASDRISELDVEVKSLKAKLAEADRKARHAEAAAEEMGRRAKAVDPERMRREIAAEMRDETSRLSDENRRLAGELHEAKSQVSKLSEDKKRLRSALNSARGR